MVSYVLDMSMVKTEQKSISDYMLGAIETLGPCYVVHLVIDYSTIWRRLGRGSEQSTFLHILDAMYGLHVEIDVEGYDMIFPWLETTYTIAKGIVKYIIYRSRVQEMLRSYSELRLMKVASGGSASRHIVLYILFLWCKWCLMFYLIRRNGELLYLM